MKFYIKATAVDDNGNEQEVMLEMRSGSMSRSGSGQVQGIISPCDFISFRFQPESGFDPFRFKGEKKNYHEV